MLCSVPAASVPPKADLGSSPAEYEQESRHAVTITKRPNGTASMLGRYVRSSGQNTHFSLFVQGGDSRSSTDRVPDDCFILHNSGIALI